jgi:hypothetical protein
MLILFQKTHHRYCRFHVVHTWRYDLDRLYACKKGIKVELESLFNFPLGPSEFEISWKVMEDKYDIWEHPAIKSLYDKREMWIIAYFKGLYFGRMTSTQRSESTNRVLKDGFVNSVTSLYQFTKKMLEALQHMDHIDVEKSHGAQVQDCF